VDSIKLLLYRGKSVNLTNTHDVTPLHLFAHFGQLHAIKLLNETDVAINNTTIDSDAALTLAAYSGKLEIFRNLNK
jgi:ankyrin repeat protein